MSRRFKPTQPKHFWTRSLATAKRNSATSLHMGKSSIRSWLYYKNIRTSSWDTSTAGIFQFQVFNTPMNNPSDMDTLTVGQQMPTTFPTLTKLYDFYLVDQDLIHLEWHQYNNLATTGTQEFHYMTFSWFDYNPSGDTVIDQVTGGTPPVNINNIKERFKQVYTLQIREYRGVVSGKIPVLKLDRKFSLRKFFGHDKADFQTTVIDPRFPLLIGSGFFFYGTGGSPAPVAPVTQIYHHWAVVNIAPMAAVTGALFPVNVNTTTTCDQNLAMYCKFYTPTSYINQLDL